ncbi:hypothetical protein J8V43_14470, partial [Photorhabdus laumondii]|uniref:hypothetical protein n=1 Tax=Photorhabdus laumondii TaxID=2218628 RepID=UPI001E42F5FD
STKLSIACSPLGAVFGAHQNFAPGTGFSSISYPEFGLVIALDNVLNHFAKIYRNRALIY